VTTPVTRAFRAGLSDHEQNALESGKFFPQTASGLPDPLVGWSDNANNAPPPDEEIANAGQWFGAQLNEFGPDRWEKHPFDEGQTIQVKWSYSTPHLTRRFKRLMTEAPRASGVAPLGALGMGFAEGEAQQNADERADNPWPDLVLIDGGEGQLAAARETLGALGVTDLPLVAIAKGPDRDAGQETFHAPGRASFKLAPRDPVLYFVQRLRDEAHRFAIGSHRARRKRDIREAGLQEIPGIGPTRKRALLRHFGTLKAIERASLSDLAQVPGISAETARRVYDFFHDGAR